DRPPAVRRPRRRCEQDLPGHRRPASRPAERRLHQAGPGVAGAGRRGEGVPGGAAGGGGTAGTDRERLAVAWGVAVQSIVLFESWILEGSVPSRIACRAFQDLAVG